MASDDTTSKPKKTSGSKIVNNATKTTLACATILVGAGLIYWQSRNSDSAAADVANHRIFICSKTLKQYEINLTPQTPIPAPSPFSGQNTGYPAELCYWTTGGQIKKEPTAVLLQNIKQPGYTGPTFCPDCGRLVVGHNPKPKPGDSPPPTREEWLARHPGAVVAP
jgi:hypothetical protein